MPILSSINQVRCLLCDLMCSAKHVTQSGIQRIFLNSGLSGTEQFRMGSIISRYAATLMSAVP